MPLADQRGEAAPLGSEQDVGVETGEIHRREEQGPAGPPAYALGGQRAEPGIGVRLGDDSVDPLQHVGGALDLGVRLQFRPADGGDLEPWVQGAQTLGHDVGLAVPEHHQTRRRRRTRRAPWASGHGEAHPGDPLGGFRVGRPLLEHTTPSCGGAAEVAGFLESFAEAAP